MRVSRKISVPSCRGEIANPNARYDRERKRNFTEEPYDRERKRNFTEEQREVERIRDRERIRIFTEEQREARRVRERERRRPTFLLLIDLQS